MKKFILLSILILSFSCGSKKNCGNECKENLNSPTEESPKNQEAHNVDVVSQNQKAAGKVNSPKPKQTAKKVSNSEKFGYWIEGKKYSATLSLMDSPLGTKGIVSLLELPPVVPVTIERKTHTASFSFIYSEEKNEFDCAFPEFDGAMLIKASAMQQFAGIMAAQWLSDHDSLGKLILDAAKETELYKISKVAKLRIEKPDFEIAIQNYEKSWSKLSGKNEDFANYRMLSFLNTEKSMLLNSEVCDLVNGDFALLDLKDATGTKHTIAVSHRS